MDGVSIVITFNVNNRPTGNVFDLGDGKVFLSSGKESRVIMSGGESVYVADTVSQASQAKGTGNMMNIHVDMFKL